MRNRDSTLCYKRILLALLLIASVKQVVIAQGASPPTYAKSVPQPTLSEVHYGPHERNVLDVWLAKAPDGQVGSRPVAFVIHGGAWLEGSKERISRVVDVKALLDAGVSVVAINYRLIAKDDLRAKIEQVDLSQNPPVHTPLYDAARALQFVRSKAEQWNLDKTRVGAAGGSAGACTSLWLLYHDDLADPGSDDPIARESTRLTCAAVRGAQTTLDPQQMVSWTPNSKYGGHAFGLLHFNVFLADREKLLPWIKKYSPYSHVSKDDPPAFLAYENKPDVGKPQQNPTHTANFGVMLQKHCRRAGIPCELRYPGAPDVQHQTVTDYLIFKLRDR